LIRSDLIPALFEVPDQCDEVRKLRIILEHGRDWYDDGRDEDDPRVRRDALCFTLKALIELFERDAQIKREGLAGHLREFIDALVELNNGRTVNLLTPATKKGRQRNTWYEDYMQGMAAGMMDREMERCPQRMQAAAKVAKMLHDAGYRTTATKAVEDKTIDGWRRRCMGHHSAEPPKMMELAFNRTRAKVNSSDPLSFDCAYKELSGLAVYVMTL